MICSYDRHGGFGIWAVRWSADGREILAGTGDSSLYVYNMTEHKARLWPPRWFQGSGCLASWGAVVISCCTSMT